ncbi:MAG: ROK family protein [Lachnospiraceae bacterium]|nr:ROK family protein [Lachnospiraceae bacterium]MDD3616075.1 ROK family protein [Lachnospiraceae bacterium]
MSNSADIRKENKKAIYRFMLDGNQYTKQQVSIGTGLSVATCNTLLNDMQMQGIVTGGDKISGEVGRSSVLYQIKDDHESYLAIHFLVEHGMKMVETILFSATGKILNQEKREYKLVDYTLVESMIEGIMEKYHGITQIIVGTPSIAEHGIVKHCDIPELENVPMKANLEARFKVPVAIENDMHHKAFGYCKKTNTENEVITLGYYPSHILPGTVTIYKGMIVKGANSFAGMTGFLPYEVNRQEQLDMLQPETCIPFIAKSICAIIVLLNPGTIVLTGDLIEENMMEKVKEKCLADIPKEYIPQFLLVDSFDEYYYEGMYQLAVEQKVL